jgi:hypothetical protein
MNGEKIKERERDFSHMKNNSLGWPSSARRKRGAEKDVKS